MSVLDQESGEMVLGGEFRRRGGAEKVVESLASIYRRALHALRLFGATCCGRFSAFRPVVTVGVAQW